MLVCISSDKIYVCIYNIGIGKLLVLYNIGRPTGKQLVLYNVGIGKQLVLYNIGL